MKYLVDIDFRTGHVGANRRSARQLRRQPVQ
jgi:hypothetical protein